MFAVRIGTNRVRHADRLSSAASWPKQTSAANRSSSNRSARGPFCRPLVLERLALPCGRTSRQSSCGGQVRPSWLNAELSQLQRFHSDQKRRDGVGRRQVQSRLVPTQQGAAALRRDCHRRSGRLRTLASGANSATRFIADPLPAVEHDDLIVWRSRQRMPKFAFQDR